MKKITLIATVMAIVSLSSCVKSHTCTCSYSIAGVTQPAAIFTANSDATDAKAWCSGIQGGLNAQPGASSITCSSN